MGECTGPCFSFETAIGGFHKFAWESKSDDLAVFQYTSGTTREMPEAVRHTHRAIVVADDRGALRDRHPARRRVLLSVVARLGAWPVARHAGAAGARRHHRAYSGRFDAVA
jgi:acyl-CoA synthetase (AMP-forming)/AMP-acid ligase II